MGEWGNVRLDRQEVEYVDVVQVCAHVTNSFLERAGFYKDYREELILMDAEQPGAPSKSLQRPHLARKLIRIVWRKEMGTNYTSYSPIASKWTKDPASILDHKGRKVCFMKRPSDLKHNPKCEYVMHNGLVLIDQNNDPVKDYPGAPRTLDNDCPGYLLEGLHRVFGMTINE